MAECEEAAVILDADAEVPLFRRVHAEAHDPLDIRNDVECTRVGAIDDCGLRLAENPVLALCVVLEAAVPVEMIR